MIGVTANGNRQLKSFYSSYGVGIGRRRRAGRRLDPAAHGSGAERARAVDLARVAAHRHLPARAPGRRRHRARPTATSRAPRWPRRTSPGVAALIVSQRHSRRPARSPPSSEHGRPDRLPARPVDLRVLPGGRQRRAAGLPGRHRLQLVQRPRPGQRAERGHTVTGLTKSAFIAFGRAVLYDSAVCYFCGRRPQK